MAETTTEIHHTHPGESHSHMHSGACADSGTGMYVLALAVIISTLMLAGAIWFSLSSLTASVDSLGGTIAAKQLSVTVPSTTDSGTGTAVKETTPTPSGVVAAQLGSKVTIDTTGRPTRGASNAKVKIIEFSDFECPYCERGYGNIESVLKEFNGSVSVTFMNYPLSFHPNAQKAAEAAECANKQGKFWEYYDTLFTTRLLTVSDLKKHASDLKLDTTAFNTCLDSGEMTKTVTDQATLGSSLGVSGTPSFFINGKLLVGAIPVDNYADSSGQMHEGLSAIITKELAS
ncbi:MAG: DsbA family protein [Candidatus Micrarchaeia archaeon]